MHVELAADVEGERPSAIAGRLEAVLADVRCAVTDWPDMRKAIERIVQDVERVSAPISVAEAAENAAFLKWLADGNFLFFGYREYGFGEGGLSVAPGAGKGLLRSDDYLVFDGLRVLTHASPGRAGVLAGAAADNDFQVEPQVLRASPGAYGHDHRQALTMAAAM